MSQLQLKKIRPDLLEDYLWETSKLNKGGNLSYDLYRYADFKSRYRQWIASIYPDIHKLITIHPDWYVEDALASFFECFKTLNHADIYEDMMSLLALVNDVTKVKSKSYPKMRREFYDIKAQIIGFLFRQHHHLGEMWWEEDEGRRYLVLTFTNNEGKVEWTFHQPERNFRDKHSRTLQSLKTLPTKPYHWETQTFLSASTLEDLTVGDYEGMVAWLSILYHLFINIYNQNQ